MEKDSKEVDDNGSLSGAAVANASLPNIASPTEKTGDREETEYEYLEGFKLYILMASISLVFFLMMLDMSIIVTVGGARPNGY